MATDSYYIVAAGDIAANSSGTSTGQARTAKVVDAWYNDTVHTPLAIFTLGDTAYDANNASQLSQNFNPYWGTGQSHWKNKKADIYPVTGNHEWREDTGTSNLFEDWPDAWVSYFTAARTASANNFCWSKELQADDGNKYWRAIGVDAAVMSLGRPPNWTATQSGTTGVGGIPFTQAQFDAFVASVKAFLRQEMDAALAANQHTICMWHEPLYTIGGYAPGIGDVAPLWDIIQDTKYNGRLRVILNGHDHLYVRYNAMRRGANNAQVTSGVDFTNGVVQLLLGNGGGARDGKHSTVTGNVAFWTGSDTADIFGAARLELTSDRVIGTWVKENGNTSTSNGTVQDTFTLGPVALNPTATGPTAHATTTTSGLTVNIDASTSTAGDVAITQYQFAWGDGNTRAYAAGATASHTYTTAGTYSIVVSVKDSAGLIDTVTKSVTVTNVVGPQPPNAVMTVTHSGLDVNVDASGSTAGTNPIQDYKVTWGDTSAGTGFITTTTMTHTYTQAGTYTVTLTVRDTSATPLTDQVATTVTVTSADTPPTARVSVTASGLSVTADASASTGGTNSINDYKFTWGDTTAGTGFTSASSAQHTYTQAGTYTVTATVRDTTLLTDAATRSVTVTDLTAGTVIPDDSGSGNNLDGEWVRGSFSTANGPTGHGKAGVFNAVDQEQVRVDDPNGLLDFTSSWTIAAWAYLNTGAGGVLNGANDRWEVMEKGGSYWMNVRHDTTPDLKVRIGGLFGGTLVSVDSPNGITAQTWVHICGTYDGSRIKMYLDGTLVATSSATPTANTDVYTQEPLVIGAKGRERAPAENVAWWNGRLDDVYVSNVALSASQVGLLVDTTFGSTPTGFSGGLWRADDARATTPTWSDISPSGVKNIEDTCWIDGTLYAVSGKAKDGTGNVGVYQSPDAGQTWVTVTSDLPLASTDQILSCDGYKDDDGNHVLFVGLYYNAQPIWRCLGINVGIPHWDAPALVDTLPDGTTYNPGWDQYAQFKMGGSLSNVMQIKVDPFSANGTSKRVYAMIGEGGIVMRSNDNGSTFRHLAVGQSILTERIVAFNPLDQSQLAIGTVDHDLIVSSDRGATFQRSVPTGTSGTGVTAVYGLDIAYDGAVYFGDVQRDSAAGYRCKGTFAADGTFSSATLQQTASSRIVGVAVGKNASAAKRIAEYRDFGNSSSGVYWSDSETTGFVKMSGSPSWTPTNLLTHGGVPMHWLNAGTGGTKMAVYVRGNGADAGIWYSANMGHATAPTISKIFSDTTNTNQRTGYLVMKGTTVIYFTRNDGSLNRLRQDSTGNWQVDGLLGAGNQCGPVTMWKGDLYVLCEAKTGGIRPRLLRASQPADTGGLTLVDLFDPGDAGLATDDYAFNLLGAAHFAVTDANIVVATDGSGTLVGDLVTWRPPNPDDQQITDDDFSGGQQGDGVFDIVDQLGRHRKSRGDEGFFADDIPPALVAKEVVGPRPIASDHGDPAEMMPPYRISVRWDRAGHTDETSERFLNTPDSGVSDAAVCGDVEFTTEMPGGFGTFTGVIPWVEYDTFEGRKAYRYAATCTIRIADTRQDGTAVPHAGSLVWQGMLRTPTPKANGTVEVNAVGWKVMAEERDEDVLFVDESYSSWVTPGSDPVAEEYSRGDNVSVEVNDHGLKFTVEQGSSVAQTEVARAVWWYEGHNPTKISGNLWWQGNYPNWRMILEKWKTPAAALVGQNNVVQTYPLTTGPASQDFLKDLTGPNLNDKPVVTIGLDNTFTSTSNQGTRVVMRVKNLRVFELVQAYKTDADDVLRILNDSTKVAQPMGYTYGLMTAKQTRGGDPLPGIMPLWWQGGTWWDLMQYLATMHAFKVAVWEGAGPNEQGAPKVEFRPWPVFRDQTNSWEYGRVWDLWGFDSALQHAEVDLSPSDDMYSDIDVSFKRKHQWRTRHNRKPIIIGGVPIFSGLPQSRKRTYKFNIEDPISDEPEFKDLPNTIANILQGELADEQFSGTVRTSFVYQYNTSDKVNVAMVRAGDMVRVRDWPNVGTVAQTGTQPKTFRIYGTRINETEGELTIGRTPIRVDQLIAQNQLALRRKGLLSSSPGT